MADSPGLGRLVSVAIGGLFGETDFGFRLEEKEPTILTGRNGSGKSTILRIINAIGVGDWPAATRLPFRTAVLQFASGAEIAVEIDGSDLTLRANGRSWRFLSDEYVENLVDEDYVRRRAEARVAQARYVYSEREYTTAELIRELTFERIIAPDDRWVLELPKQVPMLFITDQRLVASEPRVRYGLHRYPPSGRRVDEAAHELSRQIGLALSRYASRSQSLDRDFPYRVVNAMAEEAEVPEKQLEDLIQLVDDRRRQFQEVGLLPKDEEPGPFPQLLLQEQSRTVVRTFLDDTLRKFDVLEDMHQRLSLFAGFLNEHYVGKTVSIDDEYGFRIDVSAGERGSLPPSLLSSGEQQILVLAFEVLFNSDPGTVVLIDEPELSLHVVWQDTFVDDLTRLGQPDSLQFVLATHSPTLIGGRRDLTRPLDQAQ